MVRINLIPEELRTSGATPLPRRLVIYGGVAVNCLLLVLGLTYFLSTIPSLEGRKDSLGREIYQAQVIKKVESDYSSLVQKKRDFESRKATIDEISKTRVIWAKKLDQLWDMVPPEMWLTSIRLEQPKKSLANKEAESSLLIIEGFTAGPEVSKVSDFIRSLERDVPGEEDFFDVFESIKLVELYLDEENFQEYEEGLATRFVLELKLKPLQEETKKPGAAPKSAPKG
jgi:Tfp pilus assembly protein PilN